MPHLNSVMSDEQPLWKPTPEQIKSANLTKFMEFVGQATYPDLYQFSIDNPEQFWSALWDFCEVKAQQKGSCIAKNLNLIEKAEFFPEAKLNFAENLLRRRDNATAIEFFGENLIHQKISYSDLYNQVAQLIQLFQSWGISPGDRIAGYLPNIPETIIAMLAATALGAVWSSCSPDFGSQGVIDRFGQIEPKILIAADGYFYGGKRFNCLDKLAEIQAKIPSITKVLVVNYTQHQELHPYLDWQKSLQSVAPIKGDIAFVQLPFNHPLYILFSSGTTGIPKCIVHRAGGVLLQHLKEHRLHCDLKPDDRLFYFTTCGWMMWNWLVSGLASNATLILYDGSPTYPHPAYLFDIAEKAKITHFGTSAKFIDSLSKLGIDISKSHSLSSLRQILSTGSPLVPESFEYVYKHLKKDVCLSSISGGTDIVSCFILGNPIVPVWRGELQSRGLGMKVEVYNEAGQPVIGEKGELVCTAAFPCQPLGFWNDVDGSKYHKAYFAQFDNVWHHGDFVELTSHDGLIIHGRSDAVLNPGGVRIGTAEIYRQVEQIDEVIESIAVGQEWQGDIRVILFVKLRMGIILDAELIDKIKKQIRKNTTPRHVPAKIIQIQDIPRTKSGKIAELAVRNMIHGQPVKNKEALSNPEALSFYQDLSELNE